MNIVITQELNCLCVLVIRPEKPPRHCCRLSIPHSQRVGHWARRKLCWRTRASAAQTRLGVRIMQPIYAKWYRKISQTHSGRDKSQTFFFGLVQHIWLKLKPFLNPSISISRLTHGFPELLHEHVLLNNCVTVGPGTGSSVFPVFGCVCVFLKICTHWPFPRFGYEKDFSSTAHEE